MKDEEKSKSELISELKILRRKYKDLQSSLLTKKKFKEACGTETVLVVDDNDYSREIIVDMLDLYGYKILESDTSSDAIALFKSHEDTIELIISDVVMPGLNGPGMIEKIREINPGISVVFISGYAEDEILHDDVFKILDSDVPFIEKPFTLEQIGQIVRRQLDKKNNKINQDVKNDK